MNNRLSEGLSAGQCHTRDTQRQALRASRDNTLWVHFGNILLGAWLIFTRLVFGTEDGMVVGILVIVLTLPRGPIRNRYGSWERIITG